ncbi:MAG: LysR family transcriptional regulator [Nannocystaceae bacterium]|nr:LysR family transcriptional regulator [Nannocystaceae bacterium]
MNRDESSSGTTGGRIESLDELRTYVQIVETGSLAAAGRVLGITPNAVSRRLGALETRLGRRLIHRTTRRLSVTDEGLRFHERCQTVLETLAAAERELEGSDDLRGTLRIGIHPDMVCPNLMAALGELLDNEPGLDVQLSVDSRFLEPIRAGLDLAVYIGRPPSSSLVSVPLGRLVWTLAAAPRYVEAHGRPRTPKQLAAHQCLRLRRDQSESSWRLRRGSGPLQRFPVGGRFETTDGRALAQALYAGLGIGVRLRSEIDAAVKAGTLVHVLRAWEWASTPVFALMPAGRSKLPRMRAVLEVLRQATHSLSG